MQFAALIADWQARHGRHRLPWQNTRDPYRIWLSEIMLQQTQVATVIPYYERFLARFPDVQTLAAASQEEVMPYWAGLGYYARARNLHRCAQDIVAHWGGAFPPDAARIASLPGIGRSTAAAIAAFAYGERSPIMDGNVKRVFARHFGIEGDPSRRATEQALWTLAESLVAAVPDLDMTAYTQGLMDLGATLCTRGKPDCTNCPVAATCIARRDGRQQELPTPKARRAVPERQISMLVLEHKGAILLQQRPSPGIWGGLWSLPEFDAAGDADNATRTLGLEPAAHYALAAFAHTFTHYRLHVRPWYVPVHAAGLCSASLPQRWVPADALNTIALPAPIKKLLLGLTQEGFPPMLSF
ncbi:A/G-specific adenine glycosylase [Bordetella avium]|uniref:Adenine DNA glycosylase n=1 Tax=Bordetella avium (strain 197N) TaxID=360910 RepID=Q2KUI7_BORA1|nr:A/G-specific adenine glycosylase [Bordetella avium]AZY50403.1 A/G-specific adenine glycosylase [Bordetella avium]RIQ19765.1 A/G-specific adenine glycosylase [Bordetella avium]RIQ34346.1 A/G-specific adenine glycosylase [Bordetella avium]RIQ55527.1 A/G-specific adenine glycosylase [Bordetella avium]RIQ73861.1 A/G-specific adenine glycosylase [Bordetella avium]